MATYYVDQETGSDANGGTSWGDAFVSIGKALDTIKALGAGGRDSIVYIGTGTYYEGEFDQAAVPTEKPLLGLQMIGVGNVVLDLTGFDYFWTDGAVGGHSEEAYYFINLRIHGWEVQLFWNIHSWRRAILFNCFIYQKGAKYGSTSYKLGDGISRMEFENCTLFGVYSGFNEGATRLIIYQCICYGCVSYVQKTPDDDYNAANESWWRGPNGWDTATFPPPFKDADTDDPDLDFDHLHAQFLKYMLGGERGGIVGAPSSMVIMWSPGWDNYYSAGSPNNIYNLSNAGPFCADPPENDPTYYDPSWQNVVITLNTNDKIDFDEGAAELNAQIAAATYTSGADFAAACQAGINAVASDIHTVAFGSDTKRLAWDTDGTELNVLTLTGSSVDDAWSEMEFDESADKTGSLSYASDWGLTVGPFSPDNHCPAEWDTILEAWALNLDVEPNGESCRVRFGVAGLPEPKKLLFANIDRVEDGTGVVDTEQGTTTRKFEVRASNTSFGKGDAGGTTTLDWTEYAYKPTLTQINETYRYWQQRAVIRIDGTV